MIIKPKLPEDIEPQMDDLYLLTEPHLKSIGKYTIDIQDVVDFCNCPYYYKFRKENLTDKCELNRLYNKAIHQTLYNYLRALQEDKLDNSLGFLKYSWGKEWIKPIYKDVKDIMSNTAINIKNDYDFKRMAGIKAIFFFDEFIKSQEQFPIIIGHKYQVELLPNIILTGTFEYVREVTIKDQQKTIQVVRFITDPNKWNFKSRMAKHHSLQDIAAYYAFKELFKVDYFQAVTINVSSQEIYVNTFNKRDIELLKNTVKNTVICLQNNINCVSPSIHCFYCEYRKLCEKTI